jgi:hypothetical protein
MSTTGTTPAGQPEAPREPVSVRFHASLAAAAKRAATCDGAASVSEWVTGMVEQEIRRRDGRCPACGAERTPRDA